MSTKDEETQSLLRNTQKKSNGKKVLVTISAALVFLSVGVVMTLLHREAFFSGTKTHTTLIFKIHGLLTRLIIQTVLKIYLILLLVRKELWLLN